MTQNPHQAMWICMEWWSHNTPKKWFLGISGFHGILWSPCHSTQICVEYQGESKDLCGWWVDTAVGCPTGCRWSWWGKVLLMLLSEVLVVKVKGWWFLGLVFGVWAGTNVVWEVGTEWVPTWSILLMSWVWVCTDLQSTKLEKSAAKLVPYKIGNIFD